MAVDLLFDGGDRPAPAPLHSISPEVGAGNTAGEVWARGTVFLDRFLGWCAGVNVEQVPIAVAVSMISKLAHLGNAIEGLRLGLAAHTDRMSNPPLPSKEPHVSPPEPGMDPQSKDPRGKAKPLPGDHPDLIGLLQSSGGQSRD